MQKTSNSFSLLVAMGAALMPIWGGNFSEANATNAILLQHSLEEKAKKQQKEKKTKYIRPIVLFQAQPRNSDDNINFEKLKTKRVLPFPLPY